MPLSHRRAKLPQSSAFLFCQVSRSKRQSAGLSREMRSVEPDRQVRFQRLLRLKRRKGQENTSEHLQTSCKKPSMAVSSSACNHRNCLFDTAIPPTIIETGQKVDVARGDCYC